MAKGGGSRRAPRQGKSVKRTDASSPRRANTPARATRPKPAAPEPTAPEPSTFVLGAIPGATPGKWIDTWRERMPRVELELRPLAVAAQREELLSGELDAALVRLPLVADGLHVIPLYDEQPVVVVSKDSHLTAVDELNLADLEGEVVIAPLDDVLGVTVPGAVAPAFDPPETTGDAIATVGSGVGVVIVPMSLARLHQRRDAASIPLRDGPVSQVALAWPADRTTPHVDAFVGIVRGRTANSSRA
ncbi:transcriptional regulator [Microbacterium sp. 4R-513]|uniref:LysR substrate-binding domain-containing protein n=1 Tax=Microbacterium sp. 4R-513 TaxID=2567934 RepID=UPI0013E12B03|nr:LysR substrate-binding domain-containing protein [Microbacterium sp. 4R-513]QIG38638.1 transcriptional regulator [Microbacterium sp. 4R-513]